MLSRRFATARPLHNALSIARRTALSQQRGVSQVEAEYPHLVGVIRFHEQ